MNRARPRVIGQKRRWRQYKARVAGLPEGYRKAVEAIERYLMYFAASSKARRIVSMLDDLADLFEQPRRDGTPIRDDRR